MTHMKNRQSIFEQALGESWARVSPIVQKHYGLCPNSNDQVNLEGVMSVYYPLPAFFLLGPARLLGGPVLLREDNIPVKVKNSAQEDNGEMHWHRSFQLPHKNNPVIFRSRMDYVGGNEIIEYIGSNSVLCMGIKMALSEEAGAIVYESTGYCLKVGPLQIPIPGQMLLGRARIKEQAIDDQRIGMKFVIKHFLWGRVYSYGGEFAISSASS